MSAGKSNNFSYDTESKIDFRILPGIISLFTDSPLYSFESIIDYFFIIF